MYGNELAVINKCAEVGTFICVADPHDILEPPTDGEYLCSDPIYTYYIFTTYDSARGIRVVVE